MKWFSLAFLSLILLTFDVSAQDFNEIHRRIKTATENKDFSSAITELETLKKDNRKIFEVNNYDYLLARLAEKQGDFAGATANYEAVAWRNSILSEYALWHLSQIFRASGNLLMERVYLQKIIATAPASLLTKAINQRLPRSFFDSQDYDATIRLLNNPTNGNQPSAASSQQTTTIQSREKSVLLGQAYFKSGKTNEARDVFTRLITDLPNAGQPDDFALTALKTLDEMTFGAEMSAAKLPPLNDYELLRRAQIYQFNRDFPHSRFYFQAIIEKYPASGITPDAIYQVGRSFVQEKNYGEAIKWFERVQAEFPTHPVAKDALNQAASAYARLNKPQEAVARYRKFIELFPDADTLDRAYLNIVDVYRDTGANADALQWTGKTQTVFRGKTAEAVALFAQIRIRFALNDWANALSDLNNLSALPDLGGTRVPGGTNAAEVTFLKGFALENLGRFTEAIEVYLSISDGRSEYYGWRSSERLRALANDEKSKNAVGQKLANLVETTKQGVSATNANAVRQAAQSAIRLLSDAETRNEIPANLTKKEILLNVVRQTYAVLPAYQKISNGTLLDVGRREIVREKAENSAADYHKNIADELLFLTVYDEAAPELESSRQSAVSSQPKPDATQIANPKSAIQTPKSSDFAYTLAVINKRGDHADRAIAYVEPLWKNVPADYQIELLPRDRIELLYPAPYADSLLKYAPAKQVDPRFLLSIMRQESRFRPDVKSYAAARGLMQFISTTADQIAGELDRENFVQDELYNPPTAILFGSQYLGDLFRIFPNQTAAVAASYNGGEDNVARWLARAKSNDADRYVPEIIFTQSKDYVYKVLAADRVYQTVYDENLRVKQGKN